MRLYYCIHEVSTMRLPIAIVLLILVIDTAASVQSGNSAGSFYHPLKDLNNNESNYAQINSTAIDKQSIQSMMLKLPLSFIENRGQVSNDTKFMVKTPGQTIYFTPLEVLFAMALHNNTSIVRMSFEGAERGQLVGEGLLPGKANFFIGNNSSRWVTKVPTFVAVRYKNLYPGIDQIFEGTEGFLKHELVLNPGSDPEKIILTFSGQDNLNLDKNGSILIMTGNGNLTVSAPICYQDINGSRVTVEGKFRMHDDRRIGFDVENYSRSYPLVIDPPLKFSTYLGGSSGDEGHSIVVDSGGNVYVTGKTDSNNFPTKNAYQGSYGGGSSDAFVTKLNSDGSGLVYSTYLGGSGGDEGRGIVVDRAGDAFNAFVTGNTDSNNFPTKNAYQGSYGGGSSDAFVTKLNSDGSGLVYSTYLGGSGDDSGNSVALCVCNYAYVTGYTSSKDFPTKNAYQGSYGGGSIDAFVTRLNILASGTDSMVYSTYLGGSGDDQGFGIALDGSNNAYVTGKTDSNNFPTTSGAFQGSYGEESNDAFVTRLDS
jgi:hypothetical protein